MAESTVLTEVAARLRSAGCVFAEDEAALLVDAAKTPQALADLVGRREGGEPLEQILGWVEFCGLRIAVEPGVFVPRRRTEFLVEQTLCSIGPEPGLVVELCCGCAPVATVLATRRPQLEVHATDLDAAAVRCARRNLEPRGGHVHQGDLDRPLPSGLRGRVEVLMANAPYVPTHHIALLPPEARLHEPMTALDGGPDGMDILRRVIEVAPAWLAPGGRVLVESSVGQAVELAAEMQGHGLVSRVAQLPEIGATVVIVTMV